MSKQNNHIKLVRHSFTFLMALVALSGCMAMKDRYIYTPRTTNEKSATLEYSKKVHWEYTAYYPKKEIHKGTNSVTVLTVNNQYVHPEPNPEINANRIKVSPGPTEFTFLATSHGASGQITHNFNIKENEHYIMSIDRFWITLTDSKGKVSEIPFKRKSYTTSVPIITPKIR